MNIKEWYDDPKKYNCDKDVNSWILAANITKNLYLIENNFSSEKIELFNEIKSILEIIYSKYKISSEIKYKNEFFLYEFYENNINNNFKNRIEKTLENISLNNLTYEQKLNIIKNRKKVFKNLSDDMNVLDW